MVPPFFMEKDMKLYDLSRRDRYYNQGASYSPIPCGRIPVVPGQSMSMDVHVKFQTAAFTSNILSGGLVSAFFFYVPHRLVWDDWVGFIAQDDDFAGTMPSTNTDWDLVFDSAVSAGTHNCLYRRAFKLCYNEYFGNKDISGGSGGTFFYDDITADTVVSTVGLKNTEQWGGRLMTEEGIAAPTYDATTVPIDLNDFHRQMQAARSQRRAQMSGDKYVDALRRMGVEPDWRIQNAPEFLGRVDKDVMPIKTFDTSSATLGESHARFEGTLEKRISRKMFAEHGYIVGIFTMRPHMFNSASNAPPDGYAHEIDDFFLADNLRSQDEYDQADFTTGVANADAIRAKRFSYLRDGYHYPGNGSTWRMDFTTSHFENIIYQLAGNIPAGTELGGDEVALCASIHSKGGTPVPPNSI